MKIIPLLLFGTLLFLSGTPVLALDNQLKNHASPYLALHGEDPVAWQDWTADVLKNARKQNKLIYLSIGYFTCHWCHVMQQESYRNAEIAKYLNRHFIPVKIDRELEPALDARMIAFSDAVNGRSGWPLNVFLTPEGFPLYAMLYLPPAEFLDGIQKLQALWLKDHEQLVKVAREAAASGKGPGNPAIDPEAVRRYTQKLLLGIRALGDNLQGGFGEQSKFPSVPQLEFLLAWVANNPDKKMREFLLLTLDQMAEQGLRDHVGGGFFRYTVDPAWKTPHFEKMLYDNALLTRLYLRAASVFRRNDYLEVALDTLDFMNREMWDDQGAYIAALSAVDDKGVEGGYYLWSEDQLKRFLQPQELRAYKLAWSIEEAPPFENGFLPVKGQSISAISLTLKQSEARVTSWLQDARSRLYRARQSRSLPRDTKLLSGWNGLALSTLVEALRVRKDAELRKRAGRLVKYLTGQLWREQGLARALDTKGKPVGRASLEDYAYVAEGLWMWAELTGRAQDYALAKKMIREAWDRFYTPGGWVMVDDSLLPGDSAKDALADAVLAAPSAVLIQVSLRIASKTDDKVLKKRALSALNSGHKMIAADPFWYSSHILAMHLAQGMQ